MAPGVNHRGSIAREDAASLCSRIQRAGKIQPLEQKPEGSSGPLKVVKRSQFVLTPFNEVLCTEVTSLVLGKKGLNQ
jgi:hypothetical protein